MQDNISQMKAIKVFVRFAAIVLLLTAIAKIASSLSDGAILQTRDPITQLKFGWLFRVVGVLEVMVALYGFFGKKTWMSVGILAWLATSFLSYRISLVAVGYHKPCSCLGSFTDSLHIPQQIADTAMKGVLAFLLIGSYTSLIWLWRQKRGEQSVALS